MELSFNPPTTMEGRTVPVTIWWLRGAVALRGVGLGIKYLWHPSEIESELFGLLVFDWRWSESLAQRCDDASVFAYSLGSLAILLVNLVAYRALDRYTQARVWRGCEWVLLLFLATWDVALAAAITYRGGVAMSQITLASSGLRICIPVVLAHGSRRLDFDRWAYSLLAAATIATFVAHGFKALLPLPAFTTMVLASAYHLCHWEMSQSQAEGLVRAIGVADILVACLLLSTRWRWVPWYMAWWGLITAVARVTSEGWGNTAETLLRLGHFAGPLVLALAVTPLLNRAPEGVAESKHTPLA